MKVLKKAIETEPPEYNPDTQYVESNYVEDRNNILQVWDVLDKPVEELIEELS